MTSKHQIYKQLVKAASGFRDRNFSAYFIRKANTDWAPYPNDTEPPKDFLQKQEEHLRVVERQAIVSGQFPTPTYDSPQNKPKAKEETD